MGKKTRPSVSDDNKRGKSCPSASDDNKWGKSCPSVSDDNKWGEKLVRQYRTVTNGEITSVSIRQQKNGGTRGRQYRTATMVQITSLSTGQYQLEREWSVNIGLC